MFVATLVLTVHGSEHTNKINTIKAIRVPSGLGLKEAKEGTGYVIPVRPVARYEQVFDDTLMPRAVVPEQDVEPWVVAASCA